MKKLPSYIIGLLILAFFVVLFLATTAFGQIKVDQGSPGTQGGWPVTVVGAPDGGASGSLFVSPYQCNPTSPNKSTTVSTVAVSVPATNAAGRRYTTLCVSLETGGVPTLKCRTDGVAPVMGITNPGDVLGLGDCINYTVPDSRVIQCIAAGATYVTTFECLP